MSTRIYKVTSAGGAEYLVDTVSQRQAVLHVAQGFYKATVATAAEVARMMKAGIPVISPNDPPATDHPLETAE